MRVGIFAKTFARSSFTQTFEAVKACGFDCLQFNFSSAGLPTLPEAVDLWLVRQIRAELEELSLPMVAVSGTCNLIHPDRKKRGSDIARLQMLIGVCNQLGTSVVTLCAGTRDPLDMWRGHPENASPEAWSDLRASLELLLPTAERHQVTLGVEPEAANVIDSAQKARRLLDEFKSEFLKIVFDGANLVQPQGLAKQAAVLSEACDLLGPDIVLAHAKDLLDEKTVAAGKGGLDYNLYLSLLERGGFDGPLILHSLSEEEAPGALTFLRQVGRLSPKAPPPITV